MPRRSLQAIQVEHQPLRDTPAQMHGLTGAHRRYQQSNKRRVGEIGDQGRMLFLDAEPKRSAHAGTVDIKPTDKVAVFFKEGWRAYCHKLT